MAGGPRTWRRRAPTPRSGVPYRVAVPLRRDRRELERALRSVVRRGAALGGGEALADLDARLAKMLARQWCRLRLRSSPWDLQDVVVRLIGLALPPGTSSGQGATR